MPRETARGAPAQTFSSKIVIRRPPQVRSIPVNQEGGEPISVKTGKKSTVDVVARCELHRAGRFTALKSFAMAQHGESQRLSRNITDMVDTARMIP
jgi:hypothetical protein